MEANPPTNKKPRISVLIPVYSNAISLSASIESVLQQTLTDWELIIIDDGAAPATAEIIGQYTSKDKRIYCIRHDRNYGIQKSLQDGVLAASGEYIARIDDDDQWIDHEKLAKQVEFLDTNRDYVLVGTGIIGVNEHNEVLFRKLYRTTDATIRARMLFYNNFAHPTIMMRRESVIKVGNYSTNPDVKHVEDYDLWLRLGKIGKMANFDECMTQMTIHTSSLSWNNKKTQLYRILKISRSYHNDYPNRLFAFVYCTWLTVSYTLLSPFMNMQIYVLLKRFRKFLGK